MFTDIKGFTKSTSSKKREEIEKFLDLHEKLIEPIFKEYGGKVVKTIGDAFMVVFNSPTNAVLCGMEIQNKLKKYNQNPENEEIVEVRVAINSGEVHIRKGDVFGEAVNIAARIEGIAEANEIYFTESVYLAMNKAEIPSAEVGQRRLKGIPETIKVYRVLRETKDVEKAQKKRAEMVELSDNKSKSGLLKSLKNFFFKGKKKYITIIVLLFLFILITSNSSSNIIKNEDNINKFLSDANQAITLGNYNQAKTLVGKIEQLKNEDLPPRLALTTARLYYFLNRFPDAEKMIRTAKQNARTTAELTEINNFIKKSMEQVSPDKKDILRQYLTN